MNSALATADRLHAADFQLVTPFGATFTKAMDLGAVASGEIDDQVWEPVGEIAVRVYAEAAALRYQAEMEIAFRGQDLGRFRLWHTDLYERRDGQWRVVWSHATAIA